MSKSHILSDMKVMLWCWRDISILIEHGSR